MGFSALRHHFGQKVGEEFSEKRPGVWVAASLLAAVFSPMQVSGQELDHTAGQESVYETSHDIGHEMEQEDEQHTL